jgi:hypothetical protein
MPLRAAVGALVAGALMTACAASRSPAGGVAGAAAAAPPATAITPTAGVTSTTVAATTTTATTIDPGLLPQTHDLPSDTDPAFTARVAALWQGIVTGNPAVAMPFFFPLTAYRQVKAIADPDHDWQDRLVAQYGLDITRLHRLLESGASSAPAASFVRVDVPTSQSVWVLPGQEYNKGSYYRVYGTRIVYQVGGQTRFLPVYSLISWRGEWYVVHLGPIPGPAPSGPSR